MTEVKQDFHIEKLTDVYIDKIKSLKGTEMSTRIDATHSTLEPAREPSSQGVVGRNFSLDAMDKSTMSIKIPQIILFATTVTSS